MNRRAALQLRRPAVNPSSDLARPRPSRAHRSYTFTHNTRYQDPRLGFGRRSDCSWNIAVVASTYGCRTVIQRAALRMSTAVIRAEERCFSVISEGDEEFGSLILMSTGKGRAEI
jgi:hypothetical protein